MVLFYFSLWGRYIGYLWWFMVFRLERSGVFYVSYSYFEPSSEFVIFTELFQHIGSR